jgi:tRNA G10  N-methylase Trm11
MELYEIEQFDLDCTYSKGVFWKNIIQPKHKTDLIPQYDDVVVANSENLPFESNSMKSIMYDPPFVISGQSFKTNKEGSSIIAKRFEGYRNFEELKSNYYNTLKELYRLTDTGGFVVMKCQDTVSGGKNHFTHLAVMNMAIEIGFHPKDMFILLAKSRLSAFNGTKWKKQYHARKFHSYFMVFEKTKQKVNYTY